MSTVSIPAADVLNWTTHHLAREESSVTYHVVFTARARSDVIEQFRFLGYRSPAAADSWYTSSEKGYRRAAERHAPSSRG